MLGFPIWILLAFAAVVAVVFVVIAMSGDPGSDAGDRVQTTEPSVATETQPAATTTAAVATTSAPVTTAVPATLVPAALASTTAAPISVAPSTAAPTTPTPTVAPTLAPTVAPTVAPTTVQAAPTLPPDGPVVTIIGRVGPCDFGSECLLAGFALHNFNSQPTEFVCEFSDGSRYTFHFNRQQVERACATGDPTDSITIEVGGVRSATYRHP